MHYIRRLSHLSFMARQAGNNVCCDVGEHSFIIPSDNESDDEMFLLRRTKVRDLVFVVDVGNKVQYLNKPLRGISPRPFVVPVCFGGNIRS
jgi:hypothetical protein